MAFENFGLASVGCLTDKSVIKVNLPNGGFNAIKCTDATNMQSIVTAVVNRLSVGNCSNVDCYAMRVVTLESGSYWLDNDSLIFQIRNKFETMCPGSNYKFELRIRFIPANLHQLLKEDRLTFFFLYDQVRSNSLTHKSRFDEKLFDIFIDLGCIEIRKMYINLTHGSIEKSSNIDILEKDVGLHKFVPENILDRYKPKQIRKVLQQSFKKYSNYTEEDFIFKFYEILKKHIWDFSCEQFECSLGPGAGWGIQITVFIGPNEQISCRTKDAASTTTMAEFSQIEAIETFESDTGTPPKGVVQLKMKQSDDPMIITSPNLTEAIEMASLIDGYCKLQNPVQGSLWSKSTNKRNSVSIKASVTGDLERFDFLDDGDDYSQPIVDYEIDRTAIELGDTLGEGQYGSVISGIYTDSYSRKRYKVAVKSCKQPIATERFLEEAYILRRFEHLHIIRLIGIVSSPPPLIVMEFAKYGQMRSFLHKYGDELDISILVLYVYQLSQAIAYLEEKKFVHRDVAARNLLVFEFDLIKLGDFGLSRLIDDDECYYMAASKEKKLPIKWMAPESINFRKFTISSDVWMFAVCAWEILMKGVKPWTKVGNHDVVGLLEQGRKLDQPPDCPDALYAILTRCWAYEPSERLNMCDAKSQLYDIFCELHPVTSQHYSNEIPSSPEDYDDKSPPPKPPRDQLPDVNGDDDTKWLEETEKKLVPKPLISRPSGIIRH